MHRFLSTAAVGLVLLGTLGTPALAGDGAKFDNKKCAVGHGQDGTAKAMAAGSANVNDPKRQEKTPNR